MRNRTLVLAVSAALLLPACSGSGDDEPLATLAPIAPPATPSPLAPPTPPGTGVPGTTQPDFGPAPTEVLTTADLATIPAAAGYAVRDTFRPKQVPGLCGNSTDYAKAWAAEAVDAEGVRLYGEVVYDFADAATAQAFVAGLQSAQQGCSWESGNFTTTYVRQETGVKQAGDSMFAYRASFAATGSDPVGEPGTGTYVQRGARVVFFGTPATTGVDVLNSLIAAALA